jgi:hypothetical protein
MADDVQDIAIYTGSEWTSLSELAAGVVDAKLPIESVDGTVVVAGASSVFTVSTGGEERVTVDSAGNVGVGSAPHTSNRLRVDALDETLYADALAAAVVSSGTSQIFLRNSSNTPGTFSTLRFTDAGGRAGMLNFVYDSPNNNQGGSWHFTTRQANSIYKDVLVIENIQDGGNVIVNEGELQTPSVRGLVGTDASVSLGATFKAEVGTAYYQMYSSGFHVFQSDGSQSRFTDDGRFLVSTATPDEGYLSTFRQGNDGETGLVRFVTNNSDGSYSLFIDCDPSTNTATLSAVTNFQIKAIQATLTAGDGSEYVPTDSASIATKKIVDDKIWVGTTAQYLAIPIRDILPTTLYCLTD